MLATALNETKQSLNGLINCSRYAFMPNKLKYCGGKKDQELFEYCVRQETDPGLTQLLQEFQTLYPYLKLIASSNYIADPFDPQVVEAYWIGNDLLHNVSMNNFYWHFIDGLKLKKKIKPEQFNKIVGKIPDGAFPHHSFHVFNVYLRTGHLAIEHTLETMDNCRIGAGQITQILDNELEIKTQVLVYENDQLQFSEPQIKKITQKFLDKGFLEDPQINDWVTYHWNWACDIISKKQAINFHHYTQFCLNLANQNH